MSRFMYLVPAGRPRASADGWHQATATISRYCHGLCRDIAIKKKSTIRALVVILTRVICVFVAALLGFATTIIPRWFTYYVSCGLFAVFGIKMLREGSADLSHMV